MICIILRLHFTYNSGKRDMEDPDSWDNQENEPMMSSLTQSETQGKVVMLLVIILIRKMLKLCVCTTFSAIVIDFHEPVNL